MGYNFIFAAMRFHILLILLDPIVNLKSVMFGEVMATVAVLPFKSMCTYYNAYNMYFPGFTDSSFVLLLNVAVR